MLCVQVAKLFLAKRIPLENDLFRSNVTADEEFVPHHNPNASGKQEAFETDVENVYFIVGAMSFLGSILQIIGWLQSGCKFGHWTQDTEKEDQALSDSLESGWFRKLPKFHLFLASFLLCLYVFIFCVIGSNFVSFAVIFTVHTLNWAKIDGSNLVTVVFVSEIVCKSVSIVCSKFVHVHKLMIVSTLLCLGGTLLMMLCLHMTSFSLWIGASLLGLGFGNMLANSLNAGKQLTSQTGVMVSFILTSGFSGLMVAPLVTGYLYDNVDPMWFLYLGVTCSCLSLLLLVAYLAVLRCNQKGNRVEQERDIPQENQTSEV